MKQITNSTSQKLFRAFMQLRRAGWHQRTVAGCTMSEIRVLFAIRKSGTPEAPAAKVSEISRRLQVTPPTVTQMVKGLEKKGLIARRVDPADRRAFDLTLTEKGEMVTQRAHQAFLATFEGLVEYLGEERSDQLAELLFKVFQYFDERAAGFDGSTWEGDQEL